MTNGSLKPALEVESPGPGVPRVVEVPSQRFSSGILSGLPSGRQSGLRQPILPNSHADHFHSVLIVVVFHIQVCLLPFQIAYGDVVPAGLVIAVAVLLLLEFLCTYNTAAEEKTSHRVVASRRALFKQYARSWLVVDLFSSIPIQTIRMIIYRTTVASSALKFATRTFRVIVAALRLGHLYLSIRKRFQRHEKEYEKGFLAWLWYSRYAHLLAIGKLLWLVIAIVHYLACLRHGLFDNHTTSASATDIHESSFWSQYFLDMFNAICLLQGQGDGSQIESIVVNLFSILNVLLGSVLLAIVFGNGAVLVVNFNANNTNYQRKLEAVVAAMDKLQLPGPTSVLSDEASGGVRRVGYRSS